MLACQAVLLSFLCCFAAIFDFSLICFGCSNILCAAVYFLLGTKIFSQLSKRKQNPPAVRSPLSSFFAAAHCHMFCKSTLEVPALDNLFTTPCLPVPRKEENTPTWRLDFAVLNVVLLCADFVTCVELIVFAFFFD